MLNTIKSFFRIDGLLDKVFLGLLTLNSVAVYYYGYALDCWQKNCGGLSGVTFWIAANLALFLAHFGFWMRNESDEFSHIPLFRVVCVTLSLVMHLTIFFVLVPDMKEVRG